MPDEETAFIGYRSDGTRIANGETQQVVHELVHQARYNGGELDDTQVELDVDYKTADAKEGKGKIGLAAEEILTHGSPDDVAAYLQKSRKPGKSDNLPPGAFQSDTLLTDLTGSFAPSRRTLMGAISSVWRRR
ncbi:hypothetical protein E4K10_47120 [Streptomyces sp. T1317-0309]|nr:hypothetical protein E4K10_47120 [Streptomyces sp. T1317-0309]